MRKAWLGLRHLLLRVADRLNDVRAPYDLYAADLADWRRVMDT